MDGCALHLNRNYMCHCLVRGTSMVQERNIVLKRGRCPAPAFQVAFAEGGISRQFHVSEEVPILDDSLFVLGLGLGPLVAGPMSEVYGRSPVYCVSFGFFSPSLCSLWRLRRT
jgi:hypothetical protein